MNDSINDTAKDSPKDSTKDPSKDLFFLSELAKVLDSRAVLNKEMEEIEFKMYAFEMKLKDFVQNGLKTAYKRMECDEDVLDILAKYDDESGIFSYFKALSSTNGDGYEIHDSILAKNGKDIYFTYGRNSSIRLTFDHMLYLEDVDEKTALELFVEAIEFKCMRIAKEIQEKISKLRFISPVEKD